MYNCVCMIVVSYLCKYLCVYWLYGVCWFWDMLVDVDLVNNMMGW